MRKPTVVLWTAALLLLAGVLFAVNRAPAAPQKTGAAEGDVLPDFSVTCTNGDVFTLSQHRGQTVIVNLWATWCGPCVQELAAFDRLQREHGDRVFVLALHAPPATEDVKAYVGKLGYSIAFAQGTTEMIAALGGADVLPQTIVIGPDGDVTLRQTGAMAYEALARAINQK